MEFNLFIKNTLLFLSCLIENVRFFASIKKAKKVQFDLLIKNIKRNQNTKFGKDHNFNSITNLKEFREAIPVRKYEEYLPWLDSMELGEDNILTIDKIKLFEPTSGSSGGSKLIPYSGVMFDSFQKGIAVWLSDLYLNFPRLFKLKSYWLITPSIMSNQKTKGGITIGFLEDVQYLGKIAPWISDIFVNFNIPKTHFEGKNFHYAAIRFLIETKNIGLISIWHPSMLLLFMDAFDKFSDKIIDDICLGTLSNVESEIKFPAVKPNKNRALEIQRLLGDKNFWEKIWPELQVISCWGDAAAEGEAQRLHLKFPNIYMQFKGLLATEAIMTIPLINAKGNVPAFRSHFFEFEEINQKKIYEINQLKLGEKYKLILTNFGGLYRYDIGDIVQVKDFWRKLPVLKFVGRDMYIDLVGEKLSEIQIEAIVHSKKIEFPFSFLLLAPCKSIERPHYTLFIESNCDNAQLIVLQDKFEKELCNNIYYSQARLTSQLGKLRVFKITEKGQEKYIQRNSQEGQKLGNVKPRYLDIRMNWENYFSGIYID